MKDKPMRYCDFIKCGSLHPLGSGCSFMGSGENCWTIYPHEWEGQTFEDFKAYDLYLEEFNLNKTEPSCRTSRARERVTRLINLARELGLEPIYMDTDSIIVKAPNTRPVIFLLNEGSDVLGRQ